jgi:SecD/SecF fusion protein
MRPFLSRILICLVPCLIAAVVVGLAWAQFQQGKGGFKLGVDLAGGTILVYEVDLDKFPDGKVPQGFNAQELATSLKKRIDPNDLYNVTIRPVSQTRVEIILPTGGHSSRDLTAEEVERVKDLISQVGSLEFRILANNHDDRDAIEAARKYIEAQSNTQLPEAERQARKDELLHLAEKGQPPPKPINTEAGTSDPADRLLFPWKTPFAEGKTSYSWVELGRQERRSLNLDNAAENDLSPWPEKQPVGPRNAFWQRIKADRDAGRVTILEDGRGAFVIYSRESKHEDPKDKANNTPKKYEYFVLTRDPVDKQHAITGDYLINAYADTTGTKLAVSFVFNTAGGRLFYQTTSDNTPDSPNENSFHRHLAIMLDSMIESAPRLNSPISTNGQITGNFTKKEVDKLVNIFKAGALPAALKKVPVSENTMGATLGADTIKAGTFSVGLAFVAILVFMLFYYRFAGVVACVALLANLLLTVGFMVMVNASFTLPGLAGLVLMLGMAVDANVLIYERLREERDRGASLALAIRNGYDRAFPTIIDTHLSSIFTAIVLYAVGNDQLKGFGVSLTAGLIISLFTSLYMTRLMFDIWLAKGWLHKLSMVNPFEWIHRLGWMSTNVPRINFMAIRYYWFTATIVLTIFGITVFLMRGVNGLNIDFVGGTAYSGQLKEPTDISTLRAFLDENNSANQKKLEVSKVEQLDEQGRKFRITYAQGTPQDVMLPATPEGNDTVEREKNVRQRASTLPDVSVEQIFLTGEDNSGNRSRYFTIRTSEKSSGLVQLSIDRLLTGPDGASLLKKIDMYDPLVQLKGVGAEQGKAGAWVPLAEVKDPAVLKDPRVIVLRFSDFASPGHVTTLLKGQFEQIDSKDSQPFELTGISSGDALLASLPDAPDKAGKEDLEKEGRFKLMKLVLSDSAIRTVPFETPAAHPDKLSIKAILKNVQDAFRSRPQPERLETFDSAFAAETQTRALWAIVTSWGAILLYLWFRFGSWTFGLATVVCLMHDLFFTLGIIAFCHYVHHSIPGFATMVGIHDFKLDLPSIAALLTLVGYSVNDTIVVFDRIREVRGKNPELTPEMINDSVNQTLSRTLLTAFSVWLVVIVLYAFGGEGVHLFAFVMVVGVIVGTYSSIYIASPLLLIFGEGVKPATVRERKPESQPVGAE